jgi:hypothetical protein
MLDQEYYIQELNGISHKCKFDRLRVVKELLNELEIDFNLANNGLHIYFDINETRVNIWATTKKLETVYQGVHTLYVGNAKLVKTLIKLTKELK